MSEVSSANSMESPWISQDLSTSSPQTSKSERISAQVLEITKQFAEGNVEIKASLTMKAVKIARVAKPVVEELNTPKLYTRIKHFFFKPLMVDAQNQAKHQERLNVFHCLRDQMLELKQLNSINEYRNGSGSLDGKELRKMIKSDMQEPKVIKGKVERQIQQRFHAEGKEVPPNTLKNISIQVAQQLQKGKGISDVELLGIVAKECDKSGVAPPLRTNWSDLAKGLSQETDRGSDRKLERAAKELSQHIVNIDRLLSKDRSKHVGDTNKAVMNEIRAALQSEAYQHLKENEHNPCVRILHDLCVAGYLEAPVMEAYQQLNDRLDEHADNPLPDGIPGCELPTLLHERRQFLHSNGIHEADMNNPIYLAERTGSAVGAFKSLKQGRGYDPRVALENQAGGCFTEKMQIGGKEASLRHFFTPSWRIDVEVPPEARAALQSMTNRQYTQVENDTHSAKQICYNNLQNLAKPVDKETEAASSVNIMKLNQEFPDAFRGVTIPCDTALHNRGLGHGSRMWDNIYSGDHKPRSMVDFADVLKEALQNDSNFTLQNREVDGTGYYFPAKNDAEKQAWKDALGTICDFLAEKYEEITDTPLAQKVADGMELTPSEKIQWWHLESAMIEEANLMIRTLNQGIGLKDLDSREIELKQATTTVCKELADRGKAGTTIELYTQCEGNNLSKDELRAFTSIDEGRPQMARYRVGLRHRNEHRQGVLLNRSPSDLAASKTEALQMACGNATCIPGFEIVHS